MDKINYQERYEKLHIAVKKMMDAFDDYHNSKRDPAKLKKAYAIQDQVKKMINPTPKITPQQLSFLKFLAQ